MAVPVVEVKLKATFCVCVLWHGLVVVKPFHRIKVRCDCPSSLLLAPMVQENFF